MLYRLEAEFLNVHVNVNPKSYYSMWFDVTYCTDRRKRQHVSFTIS